MKVGRALTLSFGIVAILPLLIVSFMAYNAITQEIKTKTLSQLDATATKQKQKINAVLQRQKETAINLATKYQLRVALRDKDNKKIQEILKEAKTSWSEVETIWIADKENKTIVIVGENKFSEEVTNQTMWLQQNREGETELVTNIPITIDDKIIGKLGIMSSTEELGAIIGDYGNLGKTGEIAIAQKEEDGDALYLFPLRHDPEAAFKRRVTAETKDNPMLTAFNKIEMVYDNKVDYRGRPVLAATRYIDLADWGVVVKIDKEEAYGPAYLLGNNLLLTAGIIITIVTIVSGLLTQLIAKPISQLTTAVQKISLGNWDEKISLKSWQEVNTLAETFNDMTEKLAVSYKALEDKVRERTKELEAIKSQLQETNLDLDQKVKERTKELEELKNGLELTVSQRTMELKEKLIEVEKMNRLMTGRELKMIALKEEIARLKKQK